MEAMTKRETQRSTGKGVQPSNSISENCW